MTPTVAKWLRIAAVALGVVLGLAVAGDFLEPIGAIFWMAILLLLAQGFLPAAIETLLRNHLDRKLAQHAHELEVRLEGHRHALDGLLAHYTARTGALSETQLRATEKIWSQLFRVHWDVERRASPLQAVPVDPTAGPPDPDALKEAYFQQAQDELGKIDHDRVALLTAVHEQRPFLPVNVFEALEEYNALLFRIVTLLREHIEEEQDSLDDEDRRAAIARRREYRVQRDALLTQLNAANEEVVEEIRGLVSPPPPTNPSNGEG